MRPKIKMGLVALAGVIALMVVEQTKGLQWYFSRLSSTTRTDVTREPHVDDAVTTVKIDRPLFRWIPLIKFGESIYIHTYREANDATSTYKRTATTRTQLLVLGLCSTAKYDQLADAPFEKGRKETSKR
jgi:hypothetical protein